MPPTRRRPTLARPAPTPAFHPERGDATPPLAVARLVLAAAVIALAVRVAAGFSTSNWLWGIAAERYWPPGGHVALLLLAASGFVPALGRFIDRALERAGTVWERAGARGDLLVAAAVGLLLFSLRDPVRFTGDSSLREGVISLPPLATARLMTFYFPLDRVVNVVVPQWLGSYGVSPGTALQAAGSGVGAAYALACSSFLRSIQARGGARVAAAFLVLGAGTLPHFAGYDKLGPLMAGLALAAAGAARLAREGRGLWALVAGAAICVTSHRSGYLVLPAAAWTLAAAFRATRDPARRRRIGLAAAGLVVPSALMLPHALSVARRLDLATHLPGSAVAAARGAEGVSPLILHLADATNLLWFLVPLWIVGAVAVVTTRFGAESLEPEARRRRMFGLGWIAWLALIPWFAMVIVIAPGGGWARDWDNGVGLGVVASLAAAAALAAWWRRAGLARTAAPVVTMALSASIALWGVHTSEWISHRRIVSLLEGRPAWSNATRAEAYDLLGQRALSAGGAEEAVRWLTSAIACAPNPRYFHELGLAEEACGRLDRAEARFREACELNPAISDPWVGRARVALARRDSAGALACADSALARSPGKPEALEIRVALAHDRESESR